MPQEYRRRSMIIYHIVSYLYTVVSSCGVWWISYWFDTNLILLFNTSVSFQILKKKSKKKKIGSVSQGAHEIKTQPNLIHVFYLVQQASRISTTLPPFLFPYPPNVPLRRVLSLQDNNVGLHRGNGDTVRRLGEGDYGGDSGDSSDPAPTTTSSKDSAEDSMSSGDDMSTDDDMLTGGEDGTYEHMGCFMDSATDRILGHLLKSPMMTPTVSI